jgi:hypothetical protein
MSLLFERLADERSQRRATLRSDLAQPLQKLLGSDDRRTLHDYGYTRRAIMMSSEA